jgi:uncharacterized protein (DUF488 family)
MELLTVGYEGRTLRELVRLLTENGVERLVDVRERPASRKPGLSPLPLFDALRKAGITYESDRSLGTPEEIRKVWKAGRLAEGKRRYRKLLLAERRPRLELLLALAKHERVCLLCFEADPDRCHRSVIAEEAVRIEPDLAIRHL